MYVGKIRKSFDRRAPQALADWLRLKLLKEFGGIWIDASFIMLQPINEILPEEAFDGGAPFLFQNTSWTADNNYPMMENWLITAPPNDPMIRRWFHVYDAASRARKISLSLVKGLGLTQRLYQSCPPTKHFLSCASLQIVMRYTPGVRFSYLDAEKGPMLLARRMGYDGSKIASALARESGVEGISSVKLNSAWRNAVIDHLARNKLADGSVLSEIIYSPV